MSLRTLLCRSRATYKCSSYLQSKRNTYRVVSREDDKLKKPNSSEQQNQIKLVTRIEQRIKLSGPISIAEYMKEVLTNPSGGYYMTKDVFGASGDFITSPEIGQIFGEILGVWLATEWQKLGSPKPLQIVELGPGRGTLLLDILRVTKKVGLNKSNLSIHLVEVSPALQRMQADRICLAHKDSENSSFYHEGETISGCRVYWYKDLKDVPRGFSWIIAHEFFDALPIHKFQKTDKGWREILVDVDSTKTSDETKFKYTLSNNETVASKLYVQAALSDPTLDQLEVSPQSLVVAKQLANRIEEDGGIGLIADYGHKGTKGDTFRAFKSHNQTHPLENVGSSDLTADVDFHQLKRVASEAKVLGPVTQKHFLESALVQVRLKILLENATPEEQESLKSGYEMLTNTQQMGEVFKFMAIFPNISEEHYKKFPVMGFDNQ